MVIVTTEQIAHHRIVETRGQISGVVVRSRGLGGNIMAGLRSLAGGEIKEYTDATAALASLEDALKSGPVVVGMLDMGYLTYVPEHQQLHGVDHAVVVLASQPEAVIVHDPEGYHPLGGEPALWPTPVCICCAEARCFARVACWNAWQSRRNNLAQCLQYCKSRMESFPTLFS